MRYSTLALFLLAGCGGVTQEVIRDATSRTTDRLCLDALAHVKACDARFPDRTLLCTFSSDGECAPYINSEQTLCLRDATCDAVHAALDRGDWLCGVALTPASLPSRTPSPP
jgi:hypothetical protein